MKKLYKHESRSYHPFLRHNVQFYAYGKFHRKRVLLINNEFNQSQKEYAEEPIPFTYSFLNHEDETFNLQINTELRVGHITLYSHLNYFERLKLRFLFKEHWLQKVESWKFIITTLISVLAIIISIVALSRSGK